MPAVTSIIAGVATAAALGGTAYQMSSSASAAKQARDQASEQKGAQEKALKDAQDKLAADEAADAQRAQNNALRKKARQTAGAGSQFGGTILTSPLGVTAPAQTAGKTLLGS